MVSPSHAFTKKKQLKPKLEWEIRLGHPDLLIMGIDEVGRGCLAGPVAACALVLPAIVDVKLHPWIRDVTDSKELKACERERLAPLIRQWAVAHAVGWASVEEIDEINIYHAAHLAMGRAARDVVEQLRQLNQVCAHILIDGNAIPKGLPVQATAVVKGDMKCLSISAASILAKVLRDELMVKMDLEYPGYAFASHKGYSTPAHQAALREHGACLIHRRTFEPVAQALHSRRHVASSRTSDRDQSV